MEIILNPEYEKLIKEIKILKDELTSLYEEQDELKYHICKNLKIDYMNKLGSYEYKAYEFEIKVLRLRRKIELYQQKINRQEKVIDEDIEKILNTEYEEYKQKLDEMYKDLEIARELGNCPTLSEEESKELKRIYRKLIKKLHPDLNKDESNKNIDLLNKVKEAYELGDLKAMRNLEILSEEIVEKEEVELGELDELKNKKQRYISIRNDILENIKNIKDSFPYNIKNFLKDEKAIKERQEELKDIIDYYKQVYAQLEDRFDKLKGEN
jgi:hypothetical protein